MQRNLIIFRFGLSVPIPKERPILQKIAGPPGIAYGCSTQFGVISIIRSEMTPEEVKAEYARVAKETGDSLPVIVFEDGTDAAYCFDPQLFPAFEECRNLYYADPQLSITKCTLSLDELLDLVKAKGVDGLTDAEMTRLKELSK